MQWAKVQTISFIKLTNNSMTWLNRREKAWTKSARRPNKRWVSSVFGNFFRTKNSNDNSNNTDSNEQNTSNNTATKSSWERLNKPICKSVINFIAVVSTIQVLGGFRWQCFEIVNNWQSRLRSVQSFVLILKFRLSGSIYNNWTHC